MPNQLDGNIVLVPALSGTIVHKHRMYGSMAITVSFAATIDNATLDVTGDTDIYFGDPPLNVNFPTIPAITISACGGANASASLPAITLSATGTTHPFGTLDKNIPAITLDATATQEILGSLDANLPALTITASGIDSPIGSLSKSIPAITLTASCTTDILGSFSKSVGAITLTGSAYWVGPNDGVMTIPSVTLDATCHVILIDGATGAIALSLNTKNFGLTKYTNYDYNSLCVFNGVLVGAKRTGIYELAGNDDDGTDIAWKLRTGKLDLKANRMRYVWLSGTVTGDVKLIAETADGERYEYDLEPASESDGEIKIKLGKGLKDRYLIVELMNEADQRITLDKIEIYGMPGDRK